MPTFNTLFVGKVRQNFTSLESTNQYAADLLAKTKPIEGTAISADYQTKGRGQIGSSWHSEAGKNVLLSLILYPTWLPANQQFGLSMAMALAAADTFAAFCSLAAKVKWPNDVYVAKKKVAGILIQNNLSGPNLKSTIVGLGINVNQTNFPTSLPNAGSVAIFQKEAVELSLFKDCLFSQIETRYLQLKSQAASIKKDYLAHLYQFEEWHVYKTVDSPTTFEGKITGILPSGKLEIITRTGIIRHFDLKEIQFQ